MRPQRMLCGEVSSLSEDEAVESAFSKRVALESRTAENPLGEMEYILNVA